MSNSRFVLKHAYVRGTGSSGLVQYVAKSKLHEGREGKTARPLFTDRADNLSLGEAHNWLSITGGRLEKKDVLHYILSFEDAREYKLLGDQREERQAEITRYVRRALADGFNAIGVAEMRWVAGLHLNIDNPHVHLLLNKNAILRETQELVCIPRLTAPLIAHYALQPDGTRVFSYGTIINSFAAQMDARHRDRARFLQYESPLRSVKFTRELLTSEALRVRQPTDAERLIGTWIVAELEATRGLKNLRLNNRSGKDFATEEPHQAQRDVLSPPPLATLRVEVARLDHAASEHNQPPLAAFIETETLRDILTASPRGLITAPHELNPRLEKVLDRNHQLERIAQTGLFPLNRLEAIRNSQSEEHVHAISPPVRSR